MGEGGRVTGTFTQQDYAHMARALQLAQRGLNTTTPNPRVGCIITLNDQIVGEGWHVRTGEPHAEIHALMNAGSRARGATVYVTLEPCSHHGRTPPCADALAEAGVSRVIAAMTDPNPQVSGNGLARLSAEGIHTDTGLLEAEARKLNEGFIKRMIYGHPFVRVKTASSLDGKTALSNGESKWITGEAARQDVHRLRARSCAILTGVGTIIRDDPQLNVRGCETSRQPLKVIVDSELRTPPLAVALREGKTLIACSQPDLTKSSALEAAGAQILCLPQADGKVDLNALLSALAHKGINELMTETGSVLNGALIAAGLVDEWVQYVAPALLGNGARGLFNLPEPTTLKQRLVWELTDTRQVGHDLRLTWRPASH
jgi:diaminohydroxyphosphoribosylaminopyrimidine deaminase / 5-amino-6-(5-phosphoribosylamino)uracil reductase